MCVVCVVCVVCVCVWLASVSVYEEKVYGSLACTRAVVSAPVTELELQRRSAPRGRRRQNSGAGWRAVGASLASEKELRI